MNIDLWRGLRLQPGQVIIVSCHVVAARYRKHFLRRVTAPPRRHAALHEERAIFKLALFPDPSFVLKRTAVSSHPYDTRQRPRHQKYFS